ncbi:hypothetical protein SAMN05216362_13511 [Piscibacillus halophilus]|uniref:Uncharacterized protein n=1 Tax=Piscibacillus halophilus TaxID=571933 RepID=A0A1H9K366_9BACI|nr:hypothetical protein SAMN05216362_13511 [Piscibacillus halophilus]
MLDSRKVLNQIYTRQGVPARWGTFEDPWGNALGFFEYLDKSEEKVRIREILRGEKNTL